MLSLKERLNLDQVKKNVLDSQVWRSMFRHGYEDTPRNRVLMVVDNLWLHLHPTKIRRHAIRIRFTWCMGGVTFLLFLYLVVTGVVLMFYYRPVGEYAYADIKYLEFDAPFGMFMRNMHRWAAHAMVIAVWLHMMRVFMTGSYKPPREFNWVIGGVAAHAHAHAQLHRLSAPLGSAGHLGGDGGNQHGAGHAPAGTRGAVRGNGGRHAAIRRALGSIGRNHRGPAHASALLRAALHRRSSDSGDSDDGSFLENPKRRGHIRASLGFSGHNREGRKHWRRKTR